MAHQSFIIATIVLFCFTSTVFPLGSLTPAAAFRANMQQRERSPNNLFYMNEFPTLQYAGDIKDPIIKRFKPCYYSPIQCLIKK